MDGPEYDLAYTVPATALRSRFVLLARGSSYVSLASW